jgi:hypothetical protein
MTRPTATTTACPRSSPVSTLLTFWPPLPPDRMKDTSKSLSGMTRRCLSAPCSSSRGSTSTPAKLVCRRPLALKGELRTRRCVPFSPAGGIHTFTLLTNGVLDTLAELGARSMHPAGLGQDWAHQCAGKRVVHDCNACQDAVDRADRPHQWASVYATHLTDSGETANRRLWTASSCQSAWRQETIK